MSGSIIYDQSDNRDSSGNVEVAKQDQHTEIVDLKLHRVKDTITLLENYPIDDSSLVIETTGYVPSVSDSICLKEDSAFYQADVLGITPIAGNQYTLAMDTPSDHPFTTDATGCINDDNLAVDGSTTPVIFQVSPAGLTPGTEWDITRMLLSFLGEGYGTPPNDNPDSAGFGTMVAITKGVVFRSVNGITKNIFNSKTNFDFASRAFDVDYIDSNKAGLFGVNVRRSFNGDDKNGVTIRLCGDTSDEFQVIIQDDLTDITNFTVVVQGHVVD